VSRSPDEDARDRVRSHHATASAAQAMRNRTVWVDPRFAAANDWPGRRRFRVRGRPRVKGEALVIAAGQHRKRVLSHSGWGRRPWPRGAAGVVCPMTPMAMGER